MLFIYSSSDLMATWTFFEHFTYNNLSFWIMFTFWKKTKHFLQETRQVGVCVSLFTAECTLQLVSACADRNNILFRQTG